MASLEIPSSMKALVKCNEEEGYSYEDVPVPEPVSDDVLIKVDSVSLCGSDINLYQWNSIAKVIATIPFVPGHECAGTVVKCGPRANIPLGAKVGVENHFFCGECFQCKNDDRGICSVMGQFGHGKKTQYGGCSEYTIVPARFLFVLQSNITADEIAVLEPLGVSHNAIERLEVTNEDVLVIGCGPVGLFAQCCVKVMNGKRVIAADIDDARLQTAKQLGADVTVNTRRENLKDVVNTFTDGVGIGRICECSGAASMVNSAFSMLRKGGHIVMVGLTKEPLHVEDVCADIVFKALTLKTVHGRKVYHTWKAVERLVADGTIDVKPFITHKYPMSQYEEAFRTLISGQACKIVLDPSK